MSNKERHLLKALQRLEKAAEEIRKTQGYTDKVERLKILVELLREQVPYENSSASTRSTR